MLGAEQVTPRDTLIQYPWTYSFSCCLAEGYRIGDQHRHISDWGSGRTLAFSFSNHAVPTQSAQFDAVTDNEPGSA